MNGERYMYNNKKITYSITKYHRNYYRLRPHQTLIAVNLPIVLNIISFRYIFRIIFYSRQAQLVQHTLIPIFTSIFDKRMYNIVHVHVHVHVRTCIRVCMYIYHDPLTEARHGIAQQPCI